MSDLFVPAREARAEIRVVNSRFIATLAPVFDVEEARAFIGNIREEFADATHNVPVFIIGHGASVIAHSSDDGEPSGTAGRPALAVLRGSGLGDVAVVVTRYFGGTKLGTGGLVRAYGDAVRAVLEVTPRAVKVATQTLRFTVPYSVFERLRLLVQAHGGQIIDETFAAEVTVTTRLTLGRVSAFRESLRELTRGTVEVEIVAEDDATIMSVGPS